MSREEARQALQAWGAGRGRHRRGRPPIRRAAQQAFAIATALIASCLLVFSWLAVPTDAEGRPGFPCASMRSTIVAAMAEREDVDGREALASIRLSDRSAAGHTVEEARNDAGDALADAISKGRTGLVSP